MVIGKIVWVITANQEFCFILKMKNGKAYIKGLGQLDDQINNKFWFIPQKK